MIKFDKEKYRKIAKTALKKESKRLASCYKNRLNFDILKLIKLYKVKNLLIFIPMATEPNLIKLRRKISKNCTIFVPFMVDKSLKMVKLRLPFFVSKFGIREAMDSNAYKKDIDMAIVPVIAMDTKMARVGHGAGFYDRFFANLGYRPVVVFVSIKDMYIDDKICDKHDICADFYITPTKKYIKKVCYDRDVVNRARRFDFRGWRRVANI
ncbi:MAG: 5-formyltetrahydrofolate cyclo-ligase [Campylobacter lanienae]|uniref:5-formyltetrahydrofolate cyclo-ligase n=1 Tax=Campylobacter lanienae TaxID=75658 RepID=UPI00242D2B41|nr:5-formyltetrahydrofolate cyclo-ligase [Campylobacter lanienae]MCI7363492.1 5-formyltetrahydrofolate cyclo-ligase [Campylobacter lanienae]